MSTATTHPLKFPAKKLLLCVPPTEAPPPRPPRRSRRKCVRRPGPEERWIAFEQGHLAHHLRDDDLFAAERTACGKPAFNANLHRLPIFNSFPTDYRLCRVCCVVLYRERL